MEKILCEKCHDPLERRPHRRVNLCDTCYEIARKEKAKLHMREKRTGTTEPRPRKPSPQRQVILQTTNYIAGSYNLPVIDATVDIESDSGFIDFSGKIEFYKIYGMSELFENWHSEILENENITRIYFSGRKIKDSPIEINLWYAGYSWLNGHKKDECYKIINN